MWLEISDIKDQMLSKPMEKIASRHAAGYIPDAFEDVYTLRSFYDG